MSTKFEVIEDMPFKTSGFDPAEKYKCQCFQNTLGEDYNVFGVIVTQPLQQKNQMPLTICNLWGINSSEKPLF